MEEVLVRGNDGGRILYIYRNEPTLVLGKHQNVAEEVDLEAARKEGVRIARRISGGGTVYHDLGNLNIALISPFQREQHNNYHYFLDPLIKTLASFGIAAEINNRNSLVLTSGSKISGSAQFVSRGMMLSHATLLIDSDLQRLNALLRTRTKVVRSKAVESVRSQVENIGPLLPVGVEETDLVSAVISGYGADSERVSGLDKIRRESAMLLAREKYETWAWIVGRSPEFSYVDERTGKETFVKDGMIEGEENEVRRFSPWIGRDGSVKSGGTE